MPKRPRLSANMRTPERALRIAETPTPTDDSDLQPAIEVALAGPSPAIDEQRHLTPRSSSRPENLVGITGDAFMTLSLASSIGWSQGMALQLRLSSYMLGLNRSPFRLT